MVVLALELEDFSQLCLETSALQCYIIELSRLILVTLLQLMRQTNIEMP